LSLQKTDIDIGIPHKKSEQVLMPTESRLHVSVANGPREEQQNGKTR
jgi:hypothetical protein